MPYTQSCLHADLEAQRQYHLGMTVLRTTLLPRHTAHGIGSGHRLGWQLVRRGCDAHAPAPESDELVVALICTAFPCMAVHAVKAIQDNVALGRGESARAESTEGRRARFGRPVTVDAQSEKHTRTATITAPTRPTTNPIGRTGVSSSIRSWKLM